MKKSFLFLAFILITGLANGQIIQKGNLIGTHVITVTLQPGVTMDKYLEFINSRLIPEFEKAYPEWKLYMVKGIRGENANSYGEIFVVKSQKERDKYYNPDGSDSELGKKASAKLKPVMDELAKLGTGTSKYTDWLVL